MDKSQILDLVLRREKKLARARTFRQRLLATDPRIEQLMPALEHARRFVQPKGEGGTLVEGGLDSKFLDVDESTMSAGFVISAVRRDRHGDVVLPKGCLETIEDYAKNPQVFFAHKSDEYPIGQCEKDGKFDFTVREDDILSRVYFHGSTEESDKVYDLVAKKILRAASIGFFPVYGEIIPGQFDDSSEEVDFDMGGIYFSKWSIIEWSVVAVPANPDALRGWMCSTPLKSASLRKSLEPYATPLKRNQVVGGYQPILKSVQKSEKPTSPLRKKFDIREQKLRPASVEIDFAAKHTGKKVKELQQFGVSVPGAKVGGFFSGWRNAASNWYIVDTRNMTYDGREMPPVHEVVQLNSTKSDTFLIEGIHFYELGDKKFVMSVQPTWGGLYVRFFAGVEDRAEVEQIVDRAWELAATEYNFLKGEAFSLGGQFIAKTAETWEDIFLTEKNETALKRTLAQLNKKGKDFSNRGTILMGPPGTGKTLSGRAVRNQADATFIWVSAKDFYYSGSFGGFSYAFELAKELAPAVLFFEDIDTFMSSSSIDYLKSEMDGIGRSAGIWTVLTTNFPERLPEALIDRPGRFHDVLKFDRPDRDCRTRMLAKWLPGLTAEQRKAVVDDTKGYSGAHLYELCHFAKTLQEDEEKDLADAVQTAITKIAEQRDLIDRTLRGEKAAGHARKKSLVKFPYKNGRTSRKAVLPKGPYRKASNPQDPNAPDSPSGHDPSSPNRPTPRDPTDQDTEDLSVQAVVFHTSHYHSEDECMIWLEENGYSVNNLVPGDSAEEPYVAIQFDADECRVDTAIREEVENGIEVVCCVREKGEEGEEQDTPMRDEDSKEEPQIASALAEITRSNQEIQEVLKQVAANLKVAKDAQPNDDAGNMRGVEDAAKGKHDLPDKPLGAKVLEAMHGHLKSMHDYLEEAVPLLEHKAVKAHAEKMLGHVGEHLDAVKSLGEEHFPEHFKAAGEGDEEVEDHAADGDPEPGEEEEDVDVTSDELHHGEEHDENEYQEDDLPGLPDADGDFDEDEDEEERREDRDRQNEEEDEIPEGGEDHQTPQGEVEDEEEDDEDKPKKKPGKKPRLADERSARRQVLKLAKKDVTSLTETKEFLEELAGEDNLKKSQRGACKMHAQELSAVCQKFVSKAKDEDDEDEDAEEKALVALAEKKIGRLTEIIYSLTGREV